MSPRTVVVGGGLAGLTARIAADPAAIRDRRLSLSGREKATVAARALTGRTR